MGDLSTNFDRSEFACPCGACGGFPVEPSPLLVARLQNMRNLLGRPVIITSGIRCPAHNAEEGGKPNSDHVTGEGVDLAALNSRERFQLVEAGLDSGFRRIGINFKRRFIHFGVSVANARDVLWGYE